MIPPKGLYRHFKGNLYELVDIVRHAETLEELVLYRALYGEHKLWVRPLSMWSEHVQRDGYSGPRFAPCSDESLLLPPYSLHVHPAESNTKEVDHLMKSLNQYIDHTILKPSATTADVRLLCEQAITHQFASVCVNPCHVALCRDLLAGTGVGVCTVIGFPLGANTSYIKAAEAHEAVQNGADEIDMVINVGALKDGRCGAVLSDIKAVVDASCGRCVKVIIETGLLTDAEKIMATQLSAQAGAHFVKTCTGFSGGAATPEDIRLMKAHITPGMQLKASAGIRDQPSALALINAGADRLGTSAGIAIVSSADH